MGVQQAHIEGVEVLQVPAPEKEVVGVGGHRALRKLVPPVDDAVVEVKVILKPALLGLAVKGALGFDHGGGNAQTRRLDRLRSPPRVGYTHPPAHVPHAKGDGVAHGKPSLVNDRLNGLVEFPIERAGQPILLVSQDPPGDLLASLASVQGAVVLDLEAVGMPAVIQAKEGVGQKIHFGAYQPQVCRRRRCAAGRRAVIAHARSPFVGCDILTTHGVLCVS